MAINAEVTETNEEVKEITPPKRISENLASEQAEKLLKSFPDESPTDLSDTEEVEEVSPPAQPRGPVDAYGREFDPALHCVDGNGVPKLNSASGRLRLKKGAPKGDYTLKAPSGSSLGGDASGRRPEASPPSPNPANVMIGKMVTGTLAGFRVWLGGADAAPTPAENEALEGSIVAWAEYENVAISPRWAGVAAVLMYMVPAALTNQGQEKISRLLGQKKPEVARE